MSGSTSSFDDKSGTWTTAPNSQALRGRLRRRGGRYPVLRRACPAASRGSAAGVQTSTSQQEQWRQGDERQFREVAYSG